MNLVREFLEDAAKKEPGKRAFLADSKEIGYWDLASLVEELALRMHRLGVRREDKVALLSPNSLDWFAIQLAVAELGATLVPLNTRFKKLELQYILKQSDAATLFVAERGAGRGYFEILAELFPGLAESGCNAVDSDEFPHLRQVIGDWRRKGLIDTVRSVSDAGDRSFPESGPDDVVLMQYTSGTTSFPKGVMLSQAQVVRDAFNLGDRVGLTSEDVLFSALPFAHVGGSVLTNLLALTHGAGILTMGQYDPKGALELIERHRPTAVNGIDSHFIDLYTNPALDRARFQQVTKGWMVGSPEVVRHVIEDLGVSHITNVYGISEASSNVTASLPDDPVDVRCNTHGKTYPDMEISIVEPESGRPLPPNVPGEILVRGYSVMKGYYNKPSETAAAVDREGWLHSGDRGFLNESGYLVFEGRMKDVLRVGGENVSALEVEDVLLSHPKVKLAAVIGIPDTRLGEVCCAYLELREGAHANVEEIIGYCSQRIASFKVPRFLRIINAMPMTESGKIQKFKLKEDFMGLKTTAKGEEPN